MLQPGRLRKVRLSFSRAWHIPVPTSGWDVPVGVQGFSLPLAAWPEREIIYSLSGFTAERALNLNDHNEFREWGHSITGVSYWNTKEKRGIWEGKQWVLTRNKPTPNFEALFLFVCFSFGCFFPSGEWVKKCICVYSFCQGCVSPWAHAWPGGARTISCLELLSCSWGWQWPRVSSCPKAQLVSLSPMVPSQTVCALPEHQEPGSGEASV